MNDNTENTKPFTVLAVRGLTLKDSFRWLGSYWLEPCETLEAATEAAEKERRERGGKYGFLIFKNGAETAVLGCFGTEALETYPGYVM